MDRVHRRRAVRQRRPEARVYSAYLDAAVELDGPEIATITEAVRDHGVFTYLGVAERGSRDRAAARSTARSSRSIRSEGVVSAHRKLMPTYEERLAWGIGDGHGLRVHDGPGGVRVGGLNCWENWMPLAGRRCTPVARTSTSRSGPAASG